MKTRHLMFTMMFALATACASDDDDAADDGASAQNDEGDSGDSAPADDSGSIDDSGSDGAADGGSSTGADIDALWDCVEPTVMEFRPLVGPGYDAAMGGLIEPLEDSYIIATTKVIVHEEEQDEFLEVSGNVTATLDASPGMVAYSLGFEPTCGFFRTLSVYRTQEEMMAFVYSDAHSEAIARYTEFTVTGKTDAWILPADEFPPTWAMADERLTAVEPL